MIDPRTPGYRRLIAILAATIAATAFLLSATALAAVASAWAGIHGPMRWGVAILLDALVVLFTAGALSERPRGARGRVAACWIGVGTLTMASAALNAAHAWASGATGWQQVAGASLAAVPSLAVWAASHLLAWTITATDAELAADAARAAATAQAEADAADAARIDAARREAAVRVAVAQAEAEADAALAELTTDGATTASAPTPAPTTPARQPRSTERPTAPVAPRTRVTVDDALRDRIIRMHREGASERTIAAACGVGKSTVHRVTAADAPPSVGGLSPLEAVA